MEVLIGGTIQGYKQFLPRGASSLSRYRMWRGCVDVAQLLDDELLLKSLEAPSYRDVKSGDLLEARRYVKNLVKVLVLIQWTTNSGDEQFGLVEHS